MRDFNWKRCAAMILCMMLIIIGGLMAQSEQTAVPLTLGETATAVIDNGGDYAYFSFTPETSGVYIWTSQGDYDTYGYLYDADMNELASDDDSGDGGNFRIEYTLSAGTTYCFGARFYSSSSTGSFDVLLSLGFSYDLDANGLLTISGAGPMTSHPWDPSDVRAVIIENGVTSICWAAFSGCDQLETVSIPDTVRVIEGVAFYGCSSLTSIIIPEGVVEIDSQAFYYSGLVSLTLPDSLTNIASDILLEVSTLTEIRCPQYSDAWYWCSDHGFGSQLIANGTTQAPSSGTFGNQLTWQFTDRTLTISGSGSMCLYDDNKPWSAQRIKYVTIENGVTDIGAYAFSNCGNLETISIPNTVVSIGSYAFYMCESLSTVQIPSSVTSIGNYAFAYCESMDSIVIPYGVTSIGSYAFISWYALTDLTFPSSVSSYADNYFPRGSDDQVSVVRCPRGCYMWNWCINNGYEDILVEAFSPETDFTWTALDNETCEITAYTGTGTEVIIPERFSGLTVTAIGANAFATNTVLSSVMFPAAVTAIGNDAFSGCSGLSEVLYNGTVAQAMAIDIGSGNQPLTNLDWTCSDGTWSNWPYPQSAHPYAPDTDQTWTYTHPTQAAALMVTFSGDTDFYWDAYLYITDGEGKELVYGIYGGLAGQTLILKGNTVTLRLTTPGSGYSMAYGFKITDIQGMTAAEYDEYITPRLLYEDGLITGLYDPEHQISNLTIPALIDGETVYGIGISAFSDIGYLDSVTIGEGITVICEDAFYGCGLSSVSLPASLQSIGISAFNDVWELKSITYQGTVTQAASVDIDLHNSKLKAIPWTCTDGAYQWSGSGVSDEGTAWSFANGVLTITRNGDMEEIFPMEETPWDELRNLTRSIVFSDGVTSISSQGFWAFGNTTDITIPASVTRIGNLAFGGNASLQTVHYGGTVADMANITIEDQNEYLAHAVWICSDGEYAAEHTGNCGENITWTLRGGTLTLTGSGAMPDYGYNADLDEWCDSPWSDEGLESYIHHVIIGSGITHLGSAAFRYLSLSSLTLPATITSIEYNVFEDTWVGKVYYGGSIAQAQGVQIESYMWSSNYQFYNISWECSDGTGYKTLTGTIGDQVSFAYSNYQLTISGVGPMDGSGPWYGANYDSPAVSRLVIEDGVTSIYSDMFAGLIIDEMTLPTSLTVVGDNAFMDGRVKKVYYNGTAADRALIQFGAYTGALQSAKWIFTVPFSGNFVLPSNTVTIEEEAFSGIAAVGVRISDAVTTIDARAFAGCSHLEMVWIPSGVTSIDASAFEGCENLMIYGESGSAAESFAQTQGYVFINVD